MRALATMLAWISTGTALCIRAMSDADLSAPSLLPGWTRKHVVAHLSANAEAIGNLLYWAKTGEEKHMYSSPEQRAADIAAGARKPAPELRSWFRESAHALMAEMAQLTDAQWQRPILTAQGRHVLAIEAPWMRSREVMVHAVDLGTGLTFTNLSGDFLEELCADIRAKRGNVPDLRGPLAEVAAYLAGRPYEGVRSSDGNPAAPPPPWL
jgi:maleylpyruvate isomerase